MSGPVNIAEGRESETTVRARLAKISQFQEQCFLMAAKNGIVEKLAPMERKDLHALSGPGEKEHVFTYDHVVAIHPMRNSALLPSQFQSVDGAGMFFRLTPEILSQLKPQLQLYKLYPRKKTSKKFPGVPLKIPMLIGESIPLLGSDKLQGDQNGSKKEHFSPMDEIFRSRSELGNVMPSSLNITFRGEDPAQVNIVDDFNFSLHFSSFQLFNHVFEYQKPGDSTKYNWSYKDLISWSERHVNQTGPIKKVSTSKKISSYDYVGAEPCPEQPTDYSGLAIAHEGMKMNEEFFEIQAVLKYDNQVNFDLVDMLGDGQRFSKTEREELKNFLHSSTLVFRLQFKEHVVVYPDATVSDPGLQINFKYSAYLEDVINSPDLNIIEVPDRESKAMGSYLANLAMAERLLKQVEAQGLKLEESLAGKDADNQAALSYSKLRSLLQKHNKSPWLINLPFRGPNQDTPLSYDNIIINSAAVQREQGRAAAAGRQPKFIWGGLKYDSDGNPSNTPENAIVVFRELVTRYRMYVKSKRRALKSTRYKLLFQILYSKARIYHLKAHLEDVGMTSGGAIGSEPAAAEHAKDDAEAAAADPANNPYEASYNSVTVVNPGSPGSRALKKIINNYTKVLKETTDMDEDSITKASEAMKQKLTSDGPLDALAGVSTGEFAGGRQKYKNIYFTTLGDLIDVAIDLATMQDPLLNGSSPTYKRGEGLYERRMGVLFGPLIDWNSGTNNNITQINLAQVPISLKLLMGFWAENVIQTDREEYLLGEFIRDVVQKLITKALGERCLEGAGSRSETVKILQFTSKMKKVNGKHIPPFYPLGPKYPPDGGSSAYLWDSGKKWDYRIVDTRFGVGGVKKHPYGSQLDFSRMVDIAADTPLEQQYNYMYIYVHNYVPARLDPTAKKNNVLKGVQYLELGKVPGVFKDYGFKRLSIPWLRESRIHAMRRKKGETQLRDVYDFEVTMFGNNIFKPGMLIFVDPRRTGGGSYQQWKELGIGGFYLITAVDHSVLHGDTFHETTITAKWVTFGECGKKQNVKTAVNIMGATDAVKTLIKKAGWTEGIVVDDNMMG